MKYTYNEVSKEFVGVIDYLDREWGEEEVYYLKAVLKYALECVNYREETENRKAIVEYMEKHHG